MRRKQSGMFAKKSCLHPGVDLSISNISGALWEAKIWCPLTFHSACALRHSCDSLRCPSPQLGAQSGEANHAA